MKTLLIPLILCLLSVTNCHFYCPKAHGEDNGENGEYGEDNGENGEHGEHPRALRKRNDCSNMNSKRGKFKV
jgi:hypothetical protein